MPRCDPGKAPAASTVTVKLAAARSFFGLRASGLKDADG